MPSTKRQISIAIERATIASPKRSRRRAPTTSPAMPEMLLLLRRAADPAVVGAHHQRALLLHAGVLRVPAHDRERAGPLGHLEHFHQLHLGAAVRDEVRDRARTLPLDDDAQVVALDQLVVVALE